MPVAGVALYRTADWMPVGSVAALAAESCAPTVSVNCFVDGAVGHEPVRVAHLEREGRTCRPPSACPRSSCSGRTVRHVSLAGARRR